MKIGARVRVSVRRVMLHLATGYPLQDLFRRVLARLRRLPAVQAGPATSLRPPSRPASGFR